MRCPYPDCYLDEHEDGEHKFGRPEKPWGTLRLVQEFCYPHTGCETCPEHLSQPLHRAEAFYIDMLGFGWALCSACAKGFQLPPIEYFKPKEQPQPRAAVPHESSTSGVFTLADRLLQRCVDLPGPSDQIKTRTEIWPGKPSPARSAKVLEFRKAGS